MSIGIRLSFARELGFQFLYPTETPKYDDWHPKTSTCWQVFGGSDYLNIRPFSALAELDTRKDELNDPANESSVGGLNELILLPDPWSSSGLAIDQAMACIGTAAITHKSALMLVLVRVTISSIAVDATPNFESIHQILRNADAHFKALLLEHKLADRAAVWHTLGGSDFVITCTPRSATDISALTHLLSRIRHTNITQIMSQVSPSCDMLPSSHAFSYVQGTFCFRSPDELISTVLKGKEFQKHEEDARLEVHMQSHCRTGA